MSQNLKISANEAERGKSPSLFAAHPRYIRSCDPRGENRIATHPSGGYFVTSSNRRNAGHRASISSSAGNTRPWRVGLAALLLLSCSPVALHAETSNAELAKEIAELKAQIREMRGAMVQTKRTVEKVKVIAERRPAPGYALPPPGPAFPVGAVPAFITADKKLQFGALTITPGGFIAAESAFRSRTVQSDINTDYRATPFGNSPLAHTNDFRFTARQSRAALLVEGAVTPTFLASAYGEFDFLSAPVTGNSNEANGFSPRVRQLYAGVDANDYGVHVVAGQIFSLATMNSKGITPRNEVTPPSIDGQYIPGFVWARQPGIRLTKDFNQKLWFSLAAEESATIFQTACPAGNNAAGAFGLGGTINGSTVNTITCSAQGTGGGFAGSGGLVSGTTSVGGVATPITGTTASDDLSLNHVPDVIGKIAYEAKFGERDVHFEGFGIYRDFYDRVAATPVGGLATTTIGNTNTNRNTTGYGVGGGVVAAVIPRRLDFQASGLFGRGIGRYGTSQLSDVIVAGDGSLKAIPEGMLLGGLTAHVTPSIDIYGFAGIEKELRTYGMNSTGSFYGLGAPSATTASIAGCNEEANTAGGAPCNSTGNGNNKAIFQLTAGFWDKIYKGSFGEVRVGAQYQYNGREVFNNIPGMMVNGAYVATNSYQPKAFDQAVLTSLRYYPFQ